MKYQITRNQINAQSSKLEEIKSNLISQAIYDLNPFNLPNEQKQPAEIAKTIDIAIAELQTISEFLKTREL